MSKDIGDVNNSSNKPRLIHIEGFAPQNDRIQILSNVDGRFNKIDHLLVINQASTFFKGLKTFGVCPDTKN